MRRCFSSGAVCAPSEADFEFRGITRGNLGLARLFAGNDQQALVELSECLAISVQLRMQRLAAESLIALAAVAARASRPEDAVRLWGAARGIHEACGVALNVVEERIEERYLRPSLGSRPLGALEEAGRSMTLDQAVADGLKVAATIRDATA